MAGRVSPNDLAAVALGNSVWVLIFLLMSGRSYSPPPLRLPMLLAVALSQKMVFQFARLYGWAWHWAGLGVLLWNAQPLMELMVLIRF